MMDRNALLTARHALSVIRESALLNHGNTKALDHALASIQEALTSSNAAYGRPESASVHTEYVSTSEAARSLGCKERWVRDLADGIGGIKVGGRWLIPKSALPQEGTE